MRRTAALLLLVAAGCGGSDTVRGDLAVSADRVFDGRRMIGDGVVVVRGDEIVAVGEDLDVDAERTIELGDATVMPGVIDLHVHLGGMPAGGARVIARSGLTTARDLGSPIETLGARDEDAPLRLLRAGPIVTAPDGYPIRFWGDEIALQVRGEARARAAVRELAARGAAVIKIALDSSASAPVLTAQEVRAIVDEAHARDLRVTAHVTAQHGAELALAGGVDELAHMPCGGVARDVLRELVEREIEIVATLHALTRIRRALYCSDPAWDAKRFVELGGRLLYGSDNEGFAKAFVDVEELRLLRRAGLGADEVLAAATSRAGEQLGLAPLGSLEEGAPADVIAVRGDARKLRDDIARPLVVVAGGRVVHEPRQEEARP